MDFCKIKTKKNLRAPRTPPIRQKNEADAKKRSEAASPFGADVGVREEYFFTVNAGR